MSAANSSRGSLGFYLELLPSTYKQLREMSVYALLLAICYILAFALPLEAAPMWRVQYRTDDQIAMNHQSAAPASTSSSSHSTYSMGNSVYMGGTASQLPTPHNPRSMPRRPDMKSFLLTTRSMAITCQRMQFMGPGNTGELFWSSAHPVHVFTRAYHDVHGAVLPEPVVTEHPVYVELYCLFAWWN
jgi:hypothetical protein